MAESMFRTACWQITTECNMECPVCLRYQVDAQASLSEKREIVQRLADFGFQGVSISGGEPLLDTDLEAVIRHAKSVGLWVALTTNGLLLTERITSLLQETDEVSLPLDGSHPCVHARTRDSEPHFFRVTELLRRETGRAFQLVVNTVLTGQNKDDLENILELLLECGVERWKLHRYYPTGVGSRNQDLFSLTDVEFLESIERLAARIAGCERPMRVLVRNTDDAVMKSFVNISPTGDVLLFGDDFEYRVVGNVRSANDLPRELAVQGFRHDVHLRRGFEGQYAGGLHGRRDAASLTARSPDVSRDGIAAQFAAVGFVELACGNQPDVTFDGK